MGEIRKWEVEHSDLLIALSDSKYSSQRKKLVMYLTCLALRADSERQNEQIISVIRATASEQAPVNIQDVCTIVSSSFTPLTSVSYSIWTNLVELLASTFVSC